MVEAWVKPQQRQEVDDDECEAREGDGVWRHGHGEALDDHICVKGLQDVLGHQTAVDGRVLVLLQPGQLLLPDIHGCVGVEGVFGAVVGKYREKTVRDGISEWDGSARFWCGKVQRSNV